jgi:hypothetical protein
VRQMISRRFRAAGDLRWTCTPSVDCSAQPPPYCDLVAANQYVLNLLGAP